MSSNFAITLSPLFKLGQTSEASYEPSWNMKSLKPTSYEEECIEDETTDSCDTCSNHSHHDDDAFSNGREEFDAFMSEDEDSAEEDLVQ